MSWERNDIRREMNEEEIHRFTLDNWKHIKKHKPTELTEREKWLLSMPKEEALKILKNFCLFLMTILVYLLIYHHLEKADLIHKISAYFHM